MLVGDVIRDDVDDRADPERPRLGDQLLRLLEGAEHGIDRPVVRDVVAGIRHRGRIPGVEPEGLDPEIAEIREARANSGEVADSVTVLVREAPDVHLVDDGVPPPSVCNRLATRRRGIRLAWLGSRRRRSCARHGDDNRTFDNPMQDLDEILQDP